MTIRARPVLVYSDASFVPWGRSGAGFVAFRGNEVAYGGCHLPDVDDIDPAELAGAGAAARFALDAFPEARTLLLTTDNSRVMAVPSGPVADGFPADQDPSGLLALCRKRGVRLEVRWRPGHARGPGEAALASNAAHALSVLGRRRGEFSGRIEGGPGWRARLMAAVGPRLVDEGLRDEGLSEEEAAGFLGLDAATVRALARAGHLRPDPRGGFGFSSAVRVREEAERLGLGPAPDGDLGEEEVAFRALPAACALHVSGGTSNGRVGVCLVREDASGLRLDGYARPADPEAYAPHEPIADMLDRIADHLLSAPARGVVDVFMADGLACKIVGSGYRPRGAPARAGDRLDAAAARVGARLRVHVVKPKRYEEPPSRGRDARDIQSAARTGMILAHLGHPQSFRVPASGDAAEAVRAEICRRSNEVSIRESLAAQESVTALCLAPVSHEADAVAAFREIARAFHEEYAGVSMLRWSLLPRPGPSGEMRLFKRGSVKSPFGAWNAPDHLAAAWSAWCGRFEALAGAYPSLAGHDPFAVPADPALAA